MLERLSKYIYFFLIAVFLILCCAYFIANQVKANKNILYFVSILLIPLFDYIISLINQEFYLNKFKINSLSLLKFIFVLFIWTMFFINGSSIGLMLTVCFFLFSILFKIDPKLAFSIAFLVFVYSLSYLISWKPKKATNLSVYVYCYLIIWVFIQIYSFYTIKKSSSEN